MEKAELLPSLYRELEVVELSQLSVMQLVNELLGISSELRAEAHLKLFKR